MLLDIDMLQIRNVSGIQSSRQLWMRGAAGVDIMGSFVNITANGSTTLRAEVRANVLPLSYTPAHMWTTPVA